MSAEREVPERRETRSYFSESMAVRVKVSSKRRESVIVVVLGGCGGWCCCGGCCCGGVAWGALVGGVSKRGFVLVNVELSCGAGAVELLDVTGAGGLVEGWGSAMLEELALIVCGEVCRQGAKSWHRGGDSEGGTRLVWELSLDCRLLPTIAKLSMWFFVKRERQSATDSRSLCELNVICSSVIVSRPWNKDHVFPGILTTHRILRVSILSSMPVTAVHMTL